MKRATIKDIASLAGVSPSTVSRALSDHPDISDPIKAEVKRIAEGLRYHPNVMAANLRKSRSNLIGLIIPEITMFFFPSVIRGIEQVVRQEGYQLLVMQSNDSLQGELGNLRVCADHLIDGLLISLSSESRDVKHLEELRDMGTPVVLFDKSAPAAPFDQILIDDRTASYNCVRYLLAHGAKRVCGLFGNPDLAITRNRLAGYNLALQEAGLDADAMPKVFANNLSDARQACKTLLQSQHPDAFFFMSDEVAAGLIPALLEAHVEVPQRCKVMGISDGQLPYLTDPAVSHFHHSGYEVGFAAAKRLIERIKNHIDPVVYETTVLKGDMVMLGTS